MKKINLGIMAVITLFFALSFTSCSKAEEEYPPITFCFEVDEDFQIETVRLSWLNDKVNILIKGGNGSYHFSNKDNTVVAIEPNSSSGLTLTALSEGESVITISDDLGNTTLMPVKVAVQTTALEFKPKKCAIYGDELTEKEIADLKQELLFVASYQIDFKFSFNESHKGSAIIYPKEVDGIAAKTYTFEFDAPTSSLTPFLPLKIDTQLYYSFLLTADDEQLLLILHRQIDESHLMPGSRSIAPQSMGTTLDVTNRYKIRYPKLERAYIMM